MCFVEKPRDSFYFIFYYDNQRNTRQKNKDTQNVMCWVKNSTCQHSKAFIKQTIKGRIGYIKSFLSAWKLRGTLGLCCFFVVFLESRRRFVYNVN
ncbi:hypothetical protein EVA_11481 [gut metagenome]|uniref:Uncharacterized protein n=1 Tax=gut metagenome TaxID=749906 RepID=J9G0Q3_9ZZZZ